MPWPQRTCSPLPHQFGVEMAAPRSSKDIPPPPMWLLLLTPVSQQLKDIAEYHGYHYFNSVVMAVIPDLILRLNVTVLLFYLLNYEVKLTDE
ncbi:hypothetical protein BD408DRAFT_435616 [Parasitella parasitica]|nr:hypothetical protein BD408DRAFT_435616 [Parasitella parasitica]